MKAFITPQFSYCPPNMDVYRGNLNKISWMHERALRLVYQNNLSFSEVSSCNQFRRENIKAIHYGLQSVRYLGPKI